MDYEALLESFYSRLPLQATNVVDVGAHAGRHTLPLARRVGMGGSCHAFEPIPSVRRTLCEKLADARLNNTVVYPFALAERSGEAEFNFVPNLPEESGLKPRHAYNAPPAKFEKIPVRVARLDEVLPPSMKVRFVKIDVEGGELDVLRGAAGVLDASRPIVAFECGAASFLGYHEKPDEIFHIFASRGYTVMSLTGVAMRTVEEFREASFVQAFWDYVAFPESDRGLARLLA